MVQYPGLSNSILPLLLLADMPIHVPMASITETPEVFDARCVECFLSDPAVRLGRSLRSELRSSERNMFMILNIVLLTISAALFVYLVYALLRPEKF